MGTEVARYGYVALGPRITLTLSALALLAVAAEAGAQPQTRSPWLEPFKEGLELMKRGSYAEACPKLAESVHITEKLVTLVKLAQCEEKLGQMPAALVHWKRARDVARDTADEHLARVEQELARIDTIVPKLRFVSSGSATIMIDGHVLASHAVSDRVAVEPGRHSVVASESGYPLVTTSVVAEPDGAETLIDIAALRRVAEQREQREHPVPKVPERAAPAKLSRAATLAPDNGGMMRTAAFAVGGAGVASLLAGSVLGLAAISKKGTSNREGCDGTTCPPGAAETRREAVTLGELSTVFFVAGGLLTAGGATLWFVGGKREAGPSTAWLGIGPTAGGVVARGAW
jgi:hypothetical protein